MVGQNEKRPWLAPACPINTDLPPGKDSRIKAAGQTRSFLLFSEPLSTNLEPRGKAQDEGLGRDHLPQPSLFMHTEPAFQRC